MGALELLRTPDECFVDLPGWPFPPRYVEVPIRSRDDESIRVHYVDEGPADGEPVLMLHGEPTWSYLYRRMIPVLAAAGLRPVALDLVGFGRSDKPAARSDHTYQAHVDWTWEALAAIGIESVTLVGQDWGGLIGLRLVAEHPERFARVVAANTFLPTGDHHPGEAFLAWQRFSQEVPELPIGRIVSSGCVTPLRPGVAAAYEAPFPEESFKAGARQFPMLVPVDPTDPAAAANRAAWLALERFDKPFLCAFSDSDPITRGADRVLRSRIPGASGQPHTTITSAGHFLQEDRGEALAQVIVEFVRATPRPPPG